MAPILGALFAIMVGLFAILPYIGYQQQSFESVRNANTAAQFRQVLNATQAYIQDNYATVQSTASKAAYSPSISVLQNYLPGYNGSIPGPTNPYGQSWNIQISLTTQGVVQALVYSAGGQAIAELQAPAIAAETGAQGGFVPYAGQYGAATTSNTARGAYGFWSQALPASINPGPGHLVGLVAFGDTGNGATTQSDYLYRVAVPGDPALNTMQTSLDMGGGTDSITDAASVQVSPNSSTPFLAELSDTTTNKDSKGNPLSGGAVLTNSPNGGANSTVMQSDSTGASATVSAKAGGTNVNSVTIAANSTQASLTVGNNSGTPNLTLISLPQSIGASCGPSTSPPTAIGEIAPNADGSGKPLVCTAQNNANGLNIATQGQGGVYSITLSKIYSQNTTAAWQLMGTNASFSQTQIVNLNQSPGYFYKNQTGKPMFISSDCPVATSPLLGGFMASITITIQGDVNTNGYSVAYNEAGNGGVTSITSLLSNVTSAPTSSAIIPPGYVFNYSTTGGVGSCAFMVTY